MPVVFRTTQRNPIPDNEASCLTNHEPANITQLKEYFKNLLARPDTKGHTIQLLETLEALLWGMETEHLYGKFGPRYDKLIKDNNFSLKKELEKIAQEIDQHSLQRFKLLDVCNEVLKGNSTIAEYNVSMSQIKQFLTTIYFLRTYFDPKPIEENISPFSSDINSYPKDDYYEYLPQMPSLSKVPKEYLYTVFIDRVSLENDLIGRKYSSLMFDGNLNETPTGSYVESCCAAYLKLASIPQEELSFSNLVECIKILLAETDDNRVFCSLMGSPLKGAYLYYESQSDRNMMLNRYNNKINLLLLHPYIISTPIYLVVTFPDITQRIATYKQFHELYLANLRSAQLVSDPVDRENSILASILFFISQLQVSHFFKNANNRLCVQILLNKLLTENCLAPTALYAPNGITEFAISLLTKYMKDHNITDIPNLHGITVALKPVLAYVKEGQQFLQRPIKEGKLPA
jgi:hypothetical protein